MEDKKLNLNGHEIDLATLQNLITQNKKFEAIKWVMDHAKVGLSEAKNFIDHFENNHSQENIGIEILMRVKDLLQQNKKVEAVKHLKNATGFGLKEAKDRIDEFEEESLEDLLKNFTGKKISKFSTTTKKLDQQGNISNVHSFEKTWVSGEEKPKDYTDDSGAKRIKTLILVAVAVLMVAYYFYQK